MSEQEAIDFLANYAFVAFPSVREWVAGTEQPNNTVRLWAKALIKCERHECEAVIDSWIDGTAECPKYMRDGIALYVRSAVMESRRKKLQAAPLQEQRKHLDEGKSMMRAIENSGLWQQHWVPLKAAVMAGEISRESALSQWNAVLDESFKRHAAGVVWNG